MKTKGFVYLASTAVLLAASANSVLAEEVAGQVPSSAANDSLALQSSQVKPPLASPEGQPQLASSSEPAKSSDIPADEQAGVQAAETSSSGSESREKATEAKEESQAGTEAKVTESSTNPVQEALAPAQEDKPAAQASQEPQGKISIVNNNPDMGTFDVVVSDVSAPQPIKSVSLPTWSSENGQDDIIWYNAVKQADGTYKASVKARDHKYSTGVYNVHLYYVLEDGKLVGAGGTQTEVAIGKPEGTIEVINNNPDTGTFEVVVSEVSSPYGVKIVSLPVWSSKNGQDDLKFYTASKAADGTYRAIIKASDHKYSTGDYNIHLYYVQDDGRMVNVGGTKTNVSLAEPKGTITIKNNNPDTGTFDVVVSDVSNPFGVKEVKLPTWSSESGQDDIIWYTAAKQADGTYKATVRAVDHKKSTGEYNVHLYYIQDDGQMVGAGGVKTTVSIARPKGTIRIENNTAKSASFDVVVSDVSSPDGVKLVSLPVWSSENGQDDLKWYNAVKQADGTYRATIKASDHKDSLGVYNVHLYYVQDNGQLVNVAGTQVSLAAKPTGTLKIENNNPDTGTFDVVVSDVSSPFGVKNVSLPIWSSENGQDDLKWYNAVKQADGTYRASVKARDHKRSTGEYNVHLYYVQNNGKLVGAGGIKTTVSMAKPKGTIRIENNNPNTGTFDVVISNISSPEEIKEISIPTWSSQGGQDDLVWYTPSKQADGSYRATVRARDHKLSTGEYNVHLYYIHADGQLVNVTGTKTTVALAQPKGTLKIANNNPDTGTFDVLVTDASSPEGIREVSLAVWSSDKGQDDLVWHTASRQSDGSYKATIRVKDHKFSTGDYNVHLYYVQEDGKLVGAGGTKLQVALTEAKGSLTVLNNDHKKGTFEVLVSNVADGYGIREVKLPIWSSQGGQDDLYWYTAEKQVDGTYKAAIDISNHRYVTGEYNIHLYYVQEDGRMVNVGGTKISTDIAAENIKPTGRLTVQKNETRNGTFEVVVSNVFSPKGVKLVSLATWSTVNGQDDLVFHNAVKQADGSYKALIRSSDHKMSTGEYNIHLYYVQNDGSLVGAGGTTTQVSRGSYQTPYFSQRDPRWAAKTYGGYNMDASGCVPTTLAMAISGITGQTVLPTTVADYLYYNTDSFNKKGFGTSSRGIVQAAQHWGLVTDVLSSVDAIKNALSLGHNVLGAVGTSVFANYPITHELVLRDYRDGKTYVLDPYNANNNGWYSVDYLFGVKSSDPTDNTEGSPFITVRA